MRFVRETHSIEIQQMDPLGSGKYLTCGQFHQHFMSAFVPIFLYQKSSNLKCKNKKASQKTFVQKKTAHKMLVKLRPN